MKNLLFITILFFSFITAKAQNGIVKGKVVNNENIAQEFTNVLLLNASDSSLIKGVVTNYDGEFLFEKLTEGKYLVEASLVGFSNSFSSIFNSKNDVIDLGSITISEGLELSEVTVVAKKPFIEMKADKIIVNVENSAVNAGNSALEVLQKSPGVTVDKDNNISLRGKQGVLVTINGKNQYMSGDELSRMLESMPAENIKNIEIISNPSAKFDAEGNSGIININLKKNENYGYNGSFNAGYRQGVKATYNTGLDLNYRSEKINIYGSGSFYDWGAYQNLDLYRVIPFGNGQTTFDQQTNMDMNGLSVNGKIGLDYTISPSTTIGLLFKNNIGQRNMDNSGMTNIFGDNAPGFSNLSVSSISGNDWNQNSYNVNLMHNFDDNGTNLTFDADLSLYNSAGLNNYDNLYTDSNGNDVQNPFKLKNDESTDIKIFASKLDFSKSFTSGYKIDVGAKISMVETDNDTRFEALENDVWVNQVDRTNNFIYKENVAAAYANLAKSFGKLSVQAGLRMEHTLSEGNSMTLDEVVSRKYTNLFPSISLSHMVGKNHSFSYTYSKRLNRPNYQSLNPFVGYLDDYTFEKGNPFLNPQYSDAFGINYGLGRSLFISANYSYTKDAISEVIEQISDENKTYQTNQNLDNMNSASLSITAPITLKEFGVSRINLTGFYNDFQSAIPSGILDNQSFGYNVYIGNEFNLPAEISMELSANYQSGLTYGLFIVTPQYGIDLGFSKTILKGKGTLKIGLDDVFKTRNNKVSVLQDDINLKVHNIRDTRRAKINFAYKFGNNKVKSARRRSTATEDEESRIQSNN